MKLLPSETCEGCGWHPVDCDCFVKKILPSILAAYIIFTMGFWAVVDWQSRMDDRGTERSGVVAEP